MIDPDLAMIFAFVLTILVLIFGMAHVFHKRTVEHDERKLELEARKAEAEAAQATTGAADYRKLEERVRVLERIATDGNHALVAQIEQLRDLHEIDAITSRREMSQ